MNDDEDDDGEDSLEYVLHQDAGDHAHGGGQAGRTHTLPLQGLLVDVGRHHQGGGAL